MSPGNRAQLSRDELARARSNIETARIAANAGKYTEAVSLAYYAAFRAVRSILSSIGQQPRSHSGLIHLFNVHFVRTGVVDSAMLSLLERAQHDRIEADYNPSVSFDAADSDQEIKVAGQFVKLADDLAAKPSR